MVLEKRKSVLGDEHPNTMASMNSLSLAYLDQGRQKEGEELHIQAESISDQIGRGSSLYYSCCR